MSKKSTIDDPDRLLISIRRDLHRHPEPGWCEFRTTSVIFSYLKSFGYQISMLDRLINTDEILGDGSDHCSEKKRAAAEGADAELIGPLRCTGLIATISSVLPDPDTGFRFDIDAVAVGESDSPDHTPNRLGFASVHPGISHACGHDGHTALGIVLAKYISDNISRLRGKFTLIFQPAEEGCRGAWSIRNLAQIRNLDRLFAFHLGICATSGQLVLHPDHFLVSNKFRVEIHGRSAHAGIEPEKGINALHCAAAAADRIFRLAEIRPSARTNLGCFTSLNAQNVICDYVSFTGECRDVTDSLNAQLYQEICSIIQEECARFGARYTITPTGIARAVVNSPQLDEPVCRAAAECGLEIIDSAPFNACEDCGHLIAAVQNEGNSAGYYVLGNKICGRHHSPDFDLDEKALTGSLHFLFRLTELIAGSAE